LVITLSCLSPRHRFAEDEYYGESFSFAVSGIALKCAGIGIAASLVLFYFKTRDELNWIDLAARIQANAFQNHIDRLSIAGAAVGALVGAPTAFFAVSDVGRSEQRHIRVLRRAVRGAAVGCAIGVFASVFLFHRIASSSH
jgi:hypothetical protein